MKKIALPLVTLFLLTACQKDESNIITTQETESNEQILNFNTYDEVLHFLAKQMPEQYDATEVNRIKGILAGPDRTNETFKRSSNVVELPVGSENALQAAIDEAGPGGTVLVKAGGHLEEDIIRVEHQISIIGENDAVINVGNGLITSFPVGINGVYIRNAARSRVSNITFDGGEGAGFGIYISNSDRSLISDCSFRNIQLPILVHESDRVSITQNVISQEIPALFEGSRGIFVISGRSARIIGNTVSGTLFGIFNSDKGGINWGNKTTGNLYGQIFCNATPDFMDENGEVFGSIEPANHWLIAMNESDNNLYAGYVVIDGANKNTLLANRASGNAAYDIDLVGDSERFGFFTPTCFKNRVFSYSDLIIKDCGEDNRVLGGNLVDISADPCM